MIPLTSWGHPALLLLVPIAIAGLAYDRARIWYRWARWQLEPWVGPP